MSKEADFELFDPSAQNKDETNNFGKIVGRVGILLGLGGVAYMAKNFKNKPADMKTSVYVIHTRMYAQGTVIAVLTVGMLHQMYTNIMHRRAAST